MVHVCPVTVPVCVFFLSKGPPCSRCFLWALYHTDTQLHPADFRTVPPGVSGLKEWRTLKRRSKDRQEGSEEPMMASSVGGHTVSFSTWSHLTLVSVRLLLSPPRVLLFISLLYVLCFLFLLHFIHPFPPVFFLLLLLRLLLCPPLLSPSV